MKNIHILQTDKPSRLHLGHLGLVLCDFNYGLNTINGQNIYITSDEEIKEGDWCINLNSLYEHKELCRIDNQIELERYAKKPSNDCKKIIFTTDQELIEDGVQAIDDDFLEWFIKNPSCEEVEVHLVPVNEFGSEITVNGYGFDKFEYKIIIPKEEREQETLEEAALRLSKDAYKKHSVKDDKLSLDEKIQRSGGFIVGFKEGMINGAKWHQKNSYSEEDMRQAIFTSFLLGVDRRNYSKELEDKLIKQFNKK